MSEYEAFLARKRQIDGDHGFDPLWMPDFLFPFQASLVEWATRKGRAALFADCGLGKTAMELVWAENVVRQTKGRVLILSRLAVAQQTISEAEKFGISAGRSPDGSLPAERIVVTNYERLHLFQPRDFAGIVCDESSILKAFDGARRTAITEFMRTIPYRLLATATAAPNDYIELGTSSEALGYLGYADMLGRFFVNDARVPFGMRRGPEWRLRGHAEGDFWRWVASWARAVRRPSDLGFADNGFDLPEITYREHVVTARTPRADMLFDVEAIGFHEEREVRRRTITERCETAAALVADTGEPAVMWCHLNAEGDLLERLIPGSRQVAGRDSDEAKEEAFAAFASGEVRVLITKPVIGAWGLNWQHCRHLTFFPSHSYEQFYQAVRRCWRFGQQRPVMVDLVCTVGDSAIQANLQRKAEQADQMFAALVAHMQDALHVERTMAYEATVQVPAWL